MKRFLEFPAGRRAKWIVLAFMLVVGGIGGSQAGKLEQAQKNEPSSFLPGSSESVKTLDLEKKFASGTVTPAVAVFRREAGLTRKDRARIASAAAALKTRPVPSRDGKAALVVVPI